MTIENAKAQMRKGTLELCILAIVEKKDCYASDIIQTMKDKNLIVVEGTLYPLLTRQKNAGLLAGMSVIGERFKKNEVYVPEVLIAARAMKAGMEVLERAINEQGGFGLWSFAVVFDPAKTRDTIAAQWAAPAHQ